MRSPKDMRIIQIDITNACPHRCSNCTRFCGHHEKPFFMDFDTFKRAVDSMEGYVGTIGIMGGEPTLHPEFERFVEYLDSRLPKEYRKRKNNFIFPQSSFMESIHDQEYENTIGYDAGGGKRDTVCGAGLWSAMGASYKKHYEIIQDIFRYQAVNDHTNAMYHQPILISRKELGIADEEWIKLRNNCWINQMWSASITPKGAFFCEVAGALDMLFDGPGGWPIEKGWWKREEKDFGEQLQWCEICGIALDTFTRDANEEIDDVSPVLYEKLKKIKSPKMKQGKYKIIQIENGIIDEESKGGGKQLEGSGRYADSYESRFSATDTVLYPEGLVGALFCKKDDSLEAIMQTVRKNQRHFKGYWIVAADKNQMDEILKEKECDNKVNILYKEGFGRKLEYLLRECSSGEYLVLHSCEVEFSDVFWTKLSKCIINPGTLHFIDFRNQKCKKNMYIKNAQKMKEGFAALLSSDAISLRKIGFDGLVYCNSIYELMQKWIPGKIVELSDDMNYKIPEIQLKPGTKYALYGTGGRGEDVFGRLKNMGAVPVMVVDSALDKQGKKFHDIIIEKPECLVENQEKFDKVVIASIHFYGEIKDELIKMGIPIGKMSLGQ